MQRPIMAIVHQNPQMVSILRTEGHMTVLSGDHDLEESTVTNELVAAIEKLLDHWQRSSLPDSGKTSPYTTAQAVARIRDWVTQLKGKSV